MNMRKIVLGIVGLLTVLFSLGQVMSLVIDGRLTSGLMLVGFLGSWFYYAKVYWK